MNADYRRFPQYDAWGEYVQSGNRGYIYITIAGQCGFKFTMNGVLVRIDELSAGTWETFTKKADREWWVEHNRTVYRTVLSCLNMFLSGTGRSR